MYLLTLPTDRINILFLATHNSDANNLDSLYKQHENIVVSFQLG